MNYPKMLYRVLWSDYKIANDEHHERQLNHDGYVEHTQLTNKFDPQDVNQDGVVSLQELRAALDGKGISYAKNASAKQLQKLLNDSAVEADDDTKADTH